MRINDVTQVGVLSMTAVPVVRAHEGTRVFASVAGAQARVAGSVVEHTTSSCVNVAAVSAGMAPAGLSGSAAGVGLEARERGVVLMAGAAEVQGYGLRLQRQTKGGLAGFHATSGFVGGTGTTSKASSTSTNGTNPIDPWDFRTSSPPG